MKKQIVLASLLLASASFCLTACGDSSSSSAASSSKADESSASTTTAATTTEKAAETTTTKAAEQKPAASGQKKGKSAVAKSKESAPAAPEGASTDGFVDAIANTVWVGVDADYNCYALGFGDEKIVFESDDGSSIEGYWGVVDGDQNIYIFEDADLTQCVAAMPWSVDMDNKLLILNDTIAMKETDATSLEQVADQLTKNAETCKAVEFLDGTYWVGVDTSDNSVSALCMEGDAIEVYEISPAGEEAAFKGKWAMDYTTLYVMDDNYKTVNEKIWALKDDGSALGFVGDSGNVIYYQQVPEENAQNIVAYLHSLVDGGASSGEEGGQEAGAEEETEEDE